MVQVILEKNSENDWSSPIDEQDHRGRAALHFAVADGEPEMVRLLKHGANTSIEDNDGLIALEYHLQPLLP